MADIFISYSQKDRDRVKRLVDALTADGYEVWWDMAIRAGESFDHLIEDTLKRVKCVVAVWSRHSVKSEWVRAESAWAKDRDRLVSVRIDEDAELPLKFYNVHTRGMMDWQGGREDQAFRELVADIHRIIGPPPAPTTVSSTESPTPPPEVPPEREAAAEAKGKAGDYAEREREAESVVNQPVSERFPLRRATIFGGLLALVISFVAAVLLDRESAERGPERGADQLVDSGKRSVEPSRQPWRAIQQALNDLGFDAGPEDGLPGQRTRGAISRFQSSRRFPPTGELTDSERARLLADAKRAAEERVDEESEPGIVFRDRLQDGSEGPEMVVIPAGRFQMGCVSGTGCRDNELPVHTVTFDKPFAIGKYEVTFAEYDRFAAATRAAKPDDAGWGRGRRPVINVNYRDAYDYAKWLSEQTGKPYRLPDESEWEYATRGGTTTPFSTGECIDTEQANYDGASSWQACPASAASRLQTMPVGSFPASPWGLCDVHGNVTEWVGGLVTENYLEGAHYWSRAAGFRGGSFSSNQESVRSAFRDGIFADIVGSAANGFRLARDL